MCVCVGGGGGEVFSPRPNIMLWKYMNWLCYLMHYLSLTVTRMHVHTLSLSHIHTHTHSDTCITSNMCTHERTHSFTSLFTLTCTHTRTHTCTHYFSLFLSLVLGIGFWNQTSLTEAKDAFLQSWTTQTVPSFKQTVLTNYSSGLKKNA